MPAFFARLFGEIDQVIASGSAPTAVRTQP